MALKAGWGDEGARLLLGRRSRTRASPKPKKKISSYRGGVTRRTGWVADQQDFRLVLPYGYGRLAGSVAREAVKVGETGGGGGIYSPEHLGKVLMLRTQRRRSGYIRPGHGMGLGKGTDG